MKKQALLKRGLVGIPLGITLGYLITIFISLFSPQGRYLPVVPSLSTAIGTEIGAVVYQTLLCGLLGAVFGAASLIWEEESWGIIKQTGIYFLVISITMLPVAYLANWMEHTLAGFLIYTAIFVTIFIIMWVIQYGFWKKKVNQINSKLTDQNLK